MKTFHRIALFFFLTVFCTVGTVQASKSTVPEKEEFYKIVAHDGSGDYTKIQDAINDCKAFPGGRITIFVKNGTYHEKIKIHEWNPDITLIGESREGTIITYGDFFSKTNLGRNSTFYTATLLVEGDGFFAKNLTIENSAGDVGQAIALSLHANNVAVMNCMILGNQDTLYASGSGFRNYLNECFIQGTTDFIFGSATVFFENCVIHSLKDSYITAASTPKGSDYGFVFKNCHLTGHKATREVYLGRPWRTYAKTVFIGCTMEGHIKPEGWHNWSNADAEKKSFYAEHDCSGPGYLPKSRVSWSHQLTRAQSKKYTLENCLGQEFAKTVKQWISESE